MGRFPRLTLLVAVAFACMGFAPLPTPEVMTLGDPRARVVVVEYGSVACGHCAVWQEDVFPLLKKRYIDTGRVKFEFREILTMPEDATMAGLMLSRCAPPSRYFEVIEALMRNQRDLFYSDRIITWLMSGARVVGMNEQQVRACTADEDLLDAINRRVAINFSDERVDGTPMFLVNDVVVDRDFGALSRAIEKAERETRGR